MDCPLCKEPMITLELEDVEIDHCITCGGVWLDAGELELLLEDSEEKDVFLSSLELDHDSKEKALKCPICNKKMEKVICGMDSKIRIDRCRRNDGIWFDKGELEEVIQLASLDRENKIVNLLRDMFGNK